MATRGFFWQSRSSQGPHFANTQEGLYTISESEPTHPLLVWEEQEATHNHQPSLKMHTAVSDTWGKLNSEKEKNNNKEAKWLSF